MKLIIDISEELYHDIKIGNSKSYSYITRNIVMCAIKNGTPLKKLRAEIEQITDTMGVSYNQYVSKIDVLKIIDKYKSESEG